MPVLFVAIGALGLTVGSFLNVVAYRVPAGLSLVRPGSQCPACGHPVRARHNVPVLGWVALRGRCFDCSAAIRIRYPVVELGTAVLFVVTAAELVRADRTAAVPAFLVLASAGVALTLIDLDTHRLPDRIVAPSYAVFLLLLVIASAVDGDWTALGRAVVGGAACAGCYLLLWLAVPAGIGFGDVKLSGLLGLALGYLSWPALAVGAFAAFLLGGLVGTALLLTGRRTRRARIAFGPFMVAGVWVALLTAQPVAASYLDLVRVA